MTPLASKATLRSVLRQHTADVHAELDALVGEWTDLRGYGHYLQGLHAFRAPVEAALSAPAPHPFEDWPRLTIADSLAGDLRDFALPPLQHTFIDAPADAHGWAGMLYVLEGSTVGARLLARRAAELGLTETRGTRHLAVQTADKSRWPLFLQRLDDPQLDAGKAAAAAERTFAHALEAFRAALSTPA